jgi:hypothetical protein
MTSLFELKARLLVDGITIDANEARRLPGRWKFRTEHLYQHDGGKTPLYAYPQELVLGHGTDRSFDTVVNVRLHADSPWRLMVEGEHVVLTGPDTELTVELPPLPAYYDTRLVSGVAASTVVQHLGADALGVIPNNYCSYFKDGSECRFCEIEPSYREAGKFPTFRKSTDTIIAAVTEAAGSDLGSEFLILTAGNLQRNDRTADYYCDILNGLRDHGMRSLYTYGSIMPPEDLGRLSLMREAGLDAVAFNLEFHRRRQFELLAPGKNAFGWERMMTALRRSVEVYGRGNVYTNFIYGIQTWREAGIPIDWDEENAACLAAVDELLFQDVVPLFTIYHSSGKNHIGDVELNASAAIAFHKELGRRCMIVGIANPVHTGLAFNIGTLGNTVYNDAFAEATREAAADRLCGCSVQAT